MSNHSERILCPNCSRPFTVEIWDFFFDEGPFWRIDDLQDEMFLATCPHCQFKTFLSYNTVYHDKDESLAVFCVDNINHMPDEQVSFMNFLAPKANQDKQHTVRIVKNTREFCEKVQILAGGLDDRIIEIIKWLVHKSEGGQNCISLYKQAYMSYEKGEDLFLHIDYADKRLCKHIPFEVYIHVQWRFAKELKDPPCETVIDAEWAERFMENFPDILTWFFEDNVLSA